MNFIYQKVNSNLCIVLILLMTFWTVLYFFTHRAEAIANNYNASGDERFYQALGEYKDGSSKPR